MSESNEMSQIINQVKSEARSENFKNFLDKNKRILAVITVLIVGGVIGFFVFNSYQKSQENKFSTIFQQSLMYQGAGDLDKAKESLKQIVDVKSAPKNIRALALLRYAGFLLDEGNNSQAVTFYLEASQCNRCDAYIRDLGGLLAVKVWISDENEIKKEDLLSRIEIIEANNKEFKYQISEQKAIYQMQSNNLEEAYKIFEYLANNPELDPTAKERFNENLKIVISKGYKPGTSKEVESKK